MAMALNIDVAPTILSYAGVPVPKEMDGMSLTPLVEKTVTLARALLLRTPLLSLGQSEQSHSANRGRSHGTLEVHHVHRSPGVRGTLRPGRTTRRKNTTLAGDAKYQDQPAGDEDAVREKEVKRLPRPFPGAMRRNKFFSVVR